MKKTVITEELRNNIINDSIHGDYRREVADRYGVSVGTVIKLCKTDPRTDWSHRGGAHCGRNVERFW